jgi:AraC-like DNA-binding protein
MSQSETFGPDQVVVRAPGEQPCEAGSSPLTNSAAQAVRLAALMLMPQRRATLPLIAQAMDLSVRTLQRRLALEGEVFSDLINCVRRELAIQLLENPASSVSEVALLLGYNRLSSFTRWFTVEFGAAPSKWTRRSPKQDQFRVRL